MSDGMQRGGSRGNRRIGGRPHQFFVPYNGLIATNLTHADINKHTLTLANTAGTGAITGETRKIIAIILTQARTAGTGFIVFYANEGIYYVYSATDYYFSAFLVINNGTQRIQYNLSVANDQFNLVCLGYVVEA